MKVIYGFGKVKSALNQNVFTLGIFDGLHIGHQYLIRRAIAKAKSLGVKAVLLTFWPHPQEVPNIVTLNQRLRLISKLGVDYCVVIEFTKRFASISAEIFMDMLMKIRPAAIFAGEDFRFGKGAKGDANLLRDYAKRYNFSLCKIRQIRINGRIVSSTLIRSLIQEGNLHLAEKLLGRPVTVEGRVIKGRSIGRLLGSPTANIKYNNQLLPPKGVYAVRIILNPERVDPPIHLRRGLNKKGYRGLCYIGTRPTFKEPALKKALNVEAHIFDFKKDIYNKTLEIEFIERIRGERKFKNKESLARRIKKDQLKAKDIL